MDMCLGGLFKRASRGSSSRQTSTEPAASQPAAKTRTREDAGQAASAEKPHQCEYAGPCTNDTSLRHKGVEIYSCVCLEGFDLLYSNPKFQEQSVASLLDCVRSNRDAGDAGFLERLLGQEKAQAAANSVLRGAPYMTVVEFDLSATSGFHNSNMGKVGSGRSSARSSRLRPRSSCEIQPAVHSGPVALTSPHDSQHVPPPDQSPVPLPKEPARVPQSTAEQPIEATRVPQSMAELSGGASFACSPKPRPEALFVPLIGGDPGATTRSVYTPGTAAAATAAAAAAAAAATRTPATSVGNSSAVAAAPAPAEATTGFGAMPPSCSLTLPLSSTNSLRPSLYSSTTFSSGTMPHGSASTAPRFITSSRSTPGMEIPISPVTVHATSKDFRNSVTGAPMLPITPYVTEHATGKAFRNSVSGAPASMHALHASPEYPPSLDRMPARYGQLPSLDCMSARCGSPSHERMSARCGSPKSGGLKLSSSALSRIRAPAHRSSSGSGFDRALTMLEVLSSNSNSMGTLSQWDSAEAATAAANVYPVDGATASANVSPVEPASATAPANAFPTTSLSSYLEQKELEGFWASDLCLGAEPQERFQHLGRDSPSLPGVFGSHRQAKAEDVANAASGPGGSGLRSPFQQAASDPFSLWKEGKMCTATSVPESGPTRLEGIVEEASASGKAIYSASPSSSEEVKTDLFEVSIHPLLPGPGRRPMAMMSLTNVSEQCQVQDALLSLAEGQLLLLSSFLPQHAIEFLAKERNAASSPQPHGLARSHRQVTLMFVDIVGFTSMANRCQPHDVMLLLNTLFSRFDSLTDEFNVHKLETAGDSYVVTAGILSCEEHNGFVSTLDSHDPAASARRVMEFAKALLAETTRVKMPHSSGEAPVQVRIGIHTGDVVSGLIGSKLPKFSLCGDAMNTASRMESSGQAGRIQVSETTHALLPEYAWQANTVMVKGKGTMRSFLWDPGVNGGWSQEVRSLSQQSSPLPQVLLGGSNPSSERLYRLSTSGAHPDLRGVSPCLAEQFQLAMCATETLICGKDHNQQLRARKASSLQGLKSLAQGSSAL